MLNRFTVYGTPRPQGSTKAFIPKGWKRAVITTDNTKLKPWRQDVAAIASSEMNGQPPLECAVSVRCSFYFLKPASAKKSITDKITKPDIDKLLRAILDSLTGICFRDDSQVVHCEAHKWFCDKDERAEIEVRGLLRT